ncbi:MAG: outer membrane beta-barrel protein [Gammaproteobacteria bacterium]|nr:outer membrane beta-barrel protein [Gammaproteobacteria bacterium]MBU1722497.1 outer membrane beta-barrel protein [Gammaproteobacteria bacterium]MBU2005530.1 outer membrane beta-barrel protein [Gammaproteobacteria bacterium]
MKKHILIAATAALSTSSAFAEGLFDTSGEGAGTFYAGVSAGQAEVDCDNCDSTGWKLFGGYKVTPNIAVEGGYYSLVNAEETVAPGVDAEVTASGLGLAGVASLPVADDLELFGKAGVMRWDAERKVTGFPTDKADGTDLLLGAGATYMVGDNWGIRGEYENVGGDLDASMYSVGATFSSL